VVCVKRTDGEIHLFPKDFGVHMCASNGENFEAAEIRKIMKEEALKPLFLMRE
jgi:hypothetical protein